MSVEIKEFCLLLRDLSLTNAQKALAILWYMDTKELDAQVRSSELARVIVEAGIGNPNPSALATSIKQTRLAIEDNGGFRLKHASRQTIRDWLPKDFAGVAPQIDHNQGFLVSAVWENTRPYIEAVCRQMNGCYVATYFDGASVMMRRLIETLIIEAYEHLKREGEIKDLQHNYYMLNGLVERASGENTHPGLHLSRDGKAALKSIKGLGDKSAHNRRYVAVKADLENVRSGLRLVSQELIQIANLKKL